MSKLNSLVATHAMSIWIPIYDHSTDLLSEILTMKRFPFQVVIKIEDMHQKKTIVEEESIQTYIEISQEQIG